MDSRELASEEMKKTRDEMMMRGMWEKRTDWEQEEVKA